MKMNKNVIHNGCALVKGEECPEQFEKEMLAAGHLEQVAAKLADKKEEPSKKKSKKEE